MSVSKIEETIDNFFDIMDDNIIQFITEKRPEEHVIHSTLRKSFNKVNEKLKEISKKYEVSFLIPKDVKDIYKLNPKYSFQSIGNNDWLLFTDAGDFVYIKKKWYVFVKHAYYNDELGSSICQQELIRILLKVRQF